MYSLFKLLQLECLLAPYKLIVVGDRVVDMFIIFPIFCLIFAIPLLSEATCITNCCIPCTHCATLLARGGECYSLSMALISLSVSLILPVFHCCLPQKCLLYIQGPKTSCGNPFLPKKRPLFTLLCSFSYRLRACAKN